MFGKFWPHTYDKVFNTPETKSEEHPNADLLKDKYGIAEPLAPEGDDDEEHATIALAVMALNY